MHAIPVLEPPNVLAARSNEVAVKLRLQLKSVSRLVFDALCHLRNLSPCSVSLALRSLDFNLAILHLNFDIVLEAKAVDVLALAADELVGKLLREVTGDAVIALSLVLDLLVDEVEQTLTIGFDLTCWSSERHGDVGLTRRPCRLVKAQELDRVS